jgi:hypothetical protein
VAIPFRIRAQSKSNPVLVPNVNRKVKRDFRLWVGIGLLLFSILTISHLVSTAGARTQSVALTHDVVAGKHLTLDDLEVVQVALPSASNYLSSIYAAIGTTTSRNMAVGELIPVSSQPSDNAKNLRRVSLPIRAGHLPALQVGDLVDIWNTPSVDGLQIPGPPLLVSRAATVADAPASTDSNSDTALTVLIPKSEVAKIITALRDGQMDVVVLTQTGSKTP